MKIQSKHYILFLLCVSVTLWLSCSQSWEPNPKEPVILNEVVIPEDRITRAPNNDVTEIYLGQMGLSDPGCLYGIEEYKETLVWLSLYDNLLTSLDVTPLYSLNHLETLYLHENSFDSLTCAAICDYEYNHRWYDLFILHDCECSK